MIICNNDNTLRLNLKNLRHHVKVNELKKTNPKWKDSKKRMTALSAVLWVLFSVTIDIFLPFLILL